MLNDQEFQNKTAETLNDLENKVSDAAEENDFEVEGGRGMLTFVFEEPPGRFIFSPQGPAKQIWVSALSTRFKFDWDEASGQFVLDKTREPFLAVVADLLKRQLGKEIKLG